MHQLIAVEISADKAETALAYADSNPALIGRAQSPHIGSLMEQAASGMLGS